MFGKIKIDLNQNTAFLFIAIATSFSYSQSNNWPEIITSDGTLFNHVYIDFEKGGVEHVDSIVLTLDSIKNLDWNGKTDLQIIAGNNYPDFYYGTFSKTNNRYKIESLLYVDGRSQTKISSDSTGRFNFTFLQLGYNFQQATPYFFPGMWGSLEIYFGNGKSLKSKILETRAIFTTRLFRYPKEKISSKKTSEFYTNGKRVPPSKMGIPGIRFKAPTR